VKFASSSFAKKKTSGVRDSSVQTRRHVNVVRSVRNIARACFVLPFFVFGFFVDSPCDVQHAFHARPSRLKACRCRPCFVNNPQTRPTRRRPNARFRYRVITVRTSLAGRARGMPGTFTHPSKWNSNVCAFPATLRQCLGRQLPRFPFCLTTWNKKRDVMSVKLVWLPHRNTHDIQYRCSKHLCTVKSVGTAQETFKSHDSRQIFEKSFSFDSPPPPPHLSTGNAI